MRHLRLSILTLCLYFIASTCFKQTNDVVSLLGVGYLPEETSNWTEGIIKVGNDVSSFYVDAAYLVEDELPNNFRLFVTSQHGKEVCLTIERSFAKHFFNYTSIPKTSVHDVVLNNQAVSLNPDTELIISPNEKGNTLNIKALLKTTEGQTILADLQNVPLVKKAH